MRAFIVTLGLGLAASATAGAAGTTVIGNLNVPTHWTVSGNPYLLTGDVTVAAQASLTIDPGVVINVAATDAAMSGVDTARVELIILGTLAANGTAAAPITFQGATSGASTWYGIEFPVGGLSSSLTYATITDTVNTVWMQTSNALTFSNVTINRTVTGITWASTASLTTSTVSISNATTGVTWTGASSLTASAVTMNTVGTGIVWTSKGTLTLSTTTMTYCSAYCLNISDDGTNGATLSVEQSSFTPQSASGTGIGVSIGTRVAATVDRTFMVMGNQGLIAAAGSSLTLTNCVIAGNLLGGVQVTQTASNIISIVNNTIDGNSWLPRGFGYGISVTAGTVGNDVTIENNAITNGTIGIQLVSGATPALLYNDVWGNTTNYSGLTKGVFDLSTNPLYNSPLPAPTTSNTVALPATTLNNYVYYSATFPYTIPAAFLNWDVTGYWNAYYSGQDYCTITAGASTIESETSSSANFTSSYSTAASFTVSVHSYYSTTSTYCVVYSVNGFGRVFTTLPTFDYHLQNLSENVTDGGVSYGSSPVIGAGDLNGYPAVDMDGFSRPYDSTNNGTLTVDIGAYETHNHLPPLANAGPAQTVLPGVTVQFSGAGSSDADGTIVSYVWNFGDGSATASGMNVSHLYPTATMSYTVTLTVTDNGVSNNTASATTTVNILPDPGPVAVPGPNQLTSVGATVHFNGSGSSSPGNSIIAYDWNFGDGSTDGNTVTATHVYATTGTYTVTLTVEDSRAVKASATMLVGVGISTFGYPTVDPGPSQNVTLGKPVTLTDAGSTSPNGAISNYSWNFGDGTAAATGASVQHTYTKVGTFVVTETVTDIGNISGSAETFVTVVSAGPPAANAGGPYSGLAGATIQFSSAGSTDAAGTINGWSWNFGDSSTAATTASPTHSYTTAGSYLVTLTVTDTLGATGTATTIANITTPQPPVANAGGPYTGVKGQNVQFNGNQSTDNAGTITSWAWQFGDGTTAAVEAPLHTYSAAGAYLVQLTITDSRSLTSTAQGTVNISALVPPVAKPGGPYSAAVNASITFNGTGSTANEGTLTTYAWNFGDGGTAATATALHSYTQPGAYLVQLTVTDSLGGSTTAATTANVTALTPPSAIPGGPYVGTEAVPVSFVGTGSSSVNGAITTWAWNFGDGKTASIASPQHAYTMPGYYVVELTVTDVAGASSSASTTANIAALPLPSVVPGGPYTGIQGAPISFDGSATTSVNGAISTWAWKFGDGGTGSVAKPVHAYTAPGIYVVELTVTDALGASASATTTADVSGLQNPIANAGGPYTGVQNENVQFNGVGSTTTNGMITAWAWDFGDGNTAAVEAPEHAYANAGSYLVQLTVTDTAGLKSTGQATANIQGVGGSASPVASTGGPYIGVQGHQIQFDGSGSTTPNGSIMSWAWSFGDGSTGTGDAPLHVYATPGAYLVQLIVTDNLGAVNSANTTANISAAAPPVANAGGPYAGLVESAVLFDGSHSTDTDVPIVTWQWAFGDGTTGSGAQAMHSYSAAGSYLVTLTVTDGAGASASQSVLATISTPTHTPPVANAGGDQTVEAGQPVTFDASGSTDSDGTITSWLWDFGDGHTANTEQATHEYAAAGTYLLRLTVTDNSGAIGQDVAVITATPVGTGVAPVAVAGASVSATVGQVVVFNGAHSTDGTGTIVAYEWDFGDGGSASGLSAAHAYAMAGTFTVTLTIVDDHGAMAKGTLTATVHAGPVANMGGSRQVNVGDSVTFDGSGSSEAGGNIKSWTWNFGDGTNGSGETVQHTYTTSGIYTVELTVTDALGVSASATAVVAVVSTTSTKPGGGCSSADGVGFFALLVALATLRRRRADAKA